MDLDYARDSQIDINALDIEFLELPKLEQRYIQQVSDMKKEYIAAVEGEKIAHENLKTVRSRLILDAHDRADELFGKSKATGPEVEAYYRTHKKYKKAKQKWIDAETELLEAEDAWNVAKDIKDLIHFTKTKALENLVTLHGQGYFAGPKMPRNINREMERKKDKEKRRKEIAKRTGKKLKRKKKK